MYHIETFHHIESQYDGIETYMYHIETHHIETHHIETHHIETYSDKTAEKNYMRVCM